MDSINPSNNFGQGHEGGRPADGRREGARPIGGPITAPHDLAAERAILGAVMLSDQARFHVAVEGGLQPEDFYAPSHQVVFAAIRQLFADNHPIDSITVIEQLKRNEALQQAGGRDAVWELSSAVTDVAALPRHIEIVKDTAVLRRTLEVTYRIQGEMVKGTMAPLDIVELAQTSVLEVNEEESTNQLRKAAESVDSTITRLQELEASGGTITGVETGFKDFDAVTHGLQPGALIVLAARPGMGKSAFALNLAENIANREGSGAVAVFSLEMPERQLMMRLLSSQAAVKNDLMQTGQVGNRWPDLLEAAERIRKSPFYIDDSSDIGITEIRAKARRLAARHPGGIDLVVVDYLQLMRADSRHESRVQAVGEMSRGLKILAHEIDAPVIALSQLSRSVESRPDKRPLLSDLRESGQIEQDADIVMFLYREDYYKPETAEPGVTDLIVSKNRSGRTGSIRLLFQKEFSRFLTMAQAGTGEGGPAARVQAAPAQPTAPQPAISQQPVEVQPEPVVEAHTPEVEAPAFANRENEFIEDDTPGFEFEL